MPDELQDWEDRGAVVANETERSVDSNADAAGDTAVEEPSARAAVRTPRPDGLPEKFWDDEQGHLRTEDLLKSYLELEQRVSAGRNADVPQSPNDYELEIKSDLFRDDPEIQTINARLHEAGFTNQQAQLVYELAEERLAPLVADLVAVSDAENQVERLHRHFGGADRWHEMSRQIAAWGRSNLPKPVFDVLGTSFEGVTTMHQMMVKNEPALVKDGVTSAGAMTEGALRSLMRDPRYWRDQDPDIVEKVRQGFQALYPE